MVAAPPRHAAAAAAVAAKAEEQALALFLLPLRVRLHDVYEAPVLRAAVAFRDEIAISRPCIMQAELKVRARLCKYLEVSGMSKVRVWLIY